MRGDYDAIAVLDPDADDVLGRLVVFGPNDLFEVASNNSPDPEDDDDEVIEPQDYAGDYPLEGDDEADLD